MEGGHDRLARVRRIRRILGGDGALLGVAMRTTLAPLWWPLMELPSIGGNVCAACGRYAADHHHVVWRSAGKLFDADGREVPKPTVPLCGFGNTSGCHGEAHALKLHFRNNDGRWEFLRLDRPLRYERAIEIEDGWRPCQI